MDRWRHLQPHLQQMMGDEEYATWIEPLSVVENRGEGLTLTSDNAIVTDWVRDHLLRDIETVARSHFGSAFRVLLAKGDAVDGGASAAANAQIAPHPFNPSFTFDRFVVGPSNQFAAAAAEAVADRPGKAYNPLYLYGGSGLGKTHLLHAIANRLSATSSPLKVVYMTTEQFVNELINCIRRKQMDAFRQTFRGVDLLLLDDIQFIAGKERTQEEFFHTFNALFESQQQIILTSDRFPKEVSGLEERLKSRFGWGLTVAIEPPDLETRVAILKSKSNQLFNIDLPNEVAFFIAKRVRSNIREIEGALRRIIANAQFTGKPITQEFAKEALKDMLAAQDKMVTMENIQKTVAEYFKIRASDLLSSKRSRTIARPRQIAMVLAKELTNHSLPEIGEAFGGRDHTTVLYATRKIAELKESDTRIAEDYGNLLRTLTS